MKAIVREELASEPALVFTRAAGAHLYDREGQRWLDLQSGSGSRWLGHNHPAVNAALRDVLALDVPNAGERPVLGRALAEQLLAIAGEPLADVVFGTSASEAMEVALRLARLATRRRRFLYLEGAFHGTTLGALSVCGVPELREGLDPLLPTCTPIRVGDWKALERELAREDVAAFVYEAVQGATCEVVPPAWVREAERLCRQHGSLLVADESLTGLGRAGAWFAYQEIGVRPDVVTIAQGLSGGQVPIAAVACTSEVARGARASMALFAENNLAMAAGVTTLAALRELDAPRRATELSEALRAGLRDIARRWDCIDRVSGRGLMLSVHFRPSTTKRLRVQQSLMGLVDAGSFATSVRDDLRRRYRVLVEVPGRGIDAIRILPPVVCEGTDVEAFLEGFDDTLASYYGYGGPAVSFGRSVAREAVRNVRMPWAAAAKGAP